MSNLSLSVLLHVLENTASRFRRRIGDPCLELIQCRRRRQDIGTVIKTPQIMKQVGARCLIIQGGGGGYSVRLTGPVHSIVDSSFHTKITTLWTVGFYLTDTLVCWHTQVVYLATIESSMLSRIRQSESCWFDLAN